VIPDRLRLDGRAIAVSGAGGGGIGTAICEAIADAGADVLAIDIAEPALAEAVGCVRQRGRRCTGMVADAADPEAASHAVARGVAELGPLRGLVNVVGGVPLSGWHRAADYPVAEFDAVVAFNLRTAFVMSQAVARHQIAARAAGSHVLLSSISASGASPYHAPYGAAKAALRQLAQTLAVEWGRYGIRCNAIAPGTISTPRASTPDDPERDRRAIPLARRGRADEIAAAVLFLLSDLASYVNGQTLVVDGGASAMLAHLDAEGVPIFMSRRDLIAQLEKPK
jgi:NAD(P)-dependent dehydrogenase (short-subunit alcohol dehydrogenase family)